VVGEGFIGFWCYTGRRGDGEGACLQTPARRGKFFMSRDRGLELYDVACGKMQVCSCLLGVRLTQTRRSGCSFDGGGALPRGQLLERLFRSKGVGNVLIAWDNGATRCRVSSYNVKCRPRTCPAEVAVSAARLILPFP
jgi:hypothetical protein